MKTVQLSELCDINPESITKDYPYDFIEYIDISSVSSGHLAISPQLLSISEAPSRAKRIVKNEDIIISMVRPNLRSFMFITNPKENTIVSTGFAVLRTKPGIYPGFVYYAITDHKFTEYLANNAIGTSYPAVDTDTILRGEIPYFSYDIQHKIASILFTYDFLIENNRRRIQLLEQSARLLYREWFVYLRFPGHEHVRIIDGVPEGWEKSTVGEKVVLNYGKALNADDRIEGSYPVYGSSGVIGTHEKPLVKGPGIIVGRKGNVGSIFWSYKDFYPIDTVYFIDSETSKYYLYHSLQNMQFINSDVAVPGLNRNLAYSRPYIIPDRKLLSLFEEAVSPIHKQTHKLLVYNEKLREACDILLPRLMNGVITV